MPTPTIRRWTFALAAALSVTAGARVVAQDAPIKTERYTLKSQILASGLASPWSVALLPDGLILITEIGRAHV